MHLIRQTHHKIRKIGGLRTRQTFEINVYTVRSPALYQINQVIN